MELNKSESLNNWIKQADHDFKMAQKIIGEGGYDTCAFLCQQAADYMISRYPDAATAAPCDEYSESDAKAKIEKTKTVLDFVKKAIKQ